jgi:hypothetical protein
MDIENKQEQTQAKINFDSDSLLIYLIPIIIGLLSWNTAGSSPDISKHEISFLNERYHELDKRVALLEAKLSSKE